MPARPNVLLILADDMGFSDIGCYGSEIRTPNLDGLAAGGLRFSSLYNCARCCPSRASLLTGLYPHQAGVGYMVNHRDHPSYLGYLRDDSATLAEVLGPAGYYTGYSGKWHVAGTWARGPGDVAKWRFDDPTHPTPTTRGFDRFYGNPAGGGSYFRPAGVIEQQTLVELPDDFYSTDHYTAKAIEMIEEAAAADRPFLVHLCYNAPHWPLHAHEADIERYRDAYRCGWDAIRTRRHEQLKGLGVLNPKWDISPRDAEAPAWPDAPYREWESLRMAVYAAMIDCMDRNIGRLVARLRELGKLDDTLILFLSDNGGCAEFLPDQRRREMTETHDGRPVRFGNVPDLAPGGPDTFMSYDLPWANASNSPFRRFKHWVHEGGISTPLIAHWPNGIRLAGGLTHEACHLIDLTATIYEVAGASYPHECAGRPVQPLEGESFSPLFAGAPWRRERSIGWEHEGNRAFRRENLKLVSRHPGAWELYDILEDRTELKDLAARHPETVQSMVRDYEAWAARCGVLPWDEFLALPNK